MAKLKSEADVEKSQYALDQARRNRINQRNYRARQQQRIKELQADQQLHRNASIVASQEVQRAAQVVVAENAVLRSILIDEFGFDETVLAERIRSRLYAQNAVTSQAPMPASASHQTAITSRIGLTASQSTNIASCSMKASRACATTAQSNNALGTSPFSNESTCIDTVRRQSAPPAPDDSVLRPLAMSQAQNVESFSSSTKMSCHKAAEILSSIRSHQTAEDIREELGCPPGAICEIDNVLLMQAMDKSV